MKKYIIITIIIIPLIYIGFWLDRNYINWQVSEKTECICEECTCPKCVQPKELKCKEGYTAELTHNCPLIVEAPPENGFGINPNSFRIIDKNVTGMFSYIKCVDKAIEDYNSQF